MVQVFGVFRVFSSEENCLISLILEMVPIDVSGAESDPGKVFKRDETMKFA